jgi:hypothetical protein
MTTYTVFRFFSVEAEMSGLPLEAAVDEMMKHAGCTYRWQHEGTETHMIVRYVGALPDTYASTRGIKSPYLRSTNPDLIAAKNEIMRGFLRTGLLGVRIITDERARRIRHEVKDVLMGSAA